MQSAVSELMIADLRLDAGGFCRPLDHTLTERRAVALPEEASCDFGDA
jgi:hypothetical protein